MLNAADKKRLRQTAHSLKPVVMIGQHGATDAVIAEIDRALSDHELIKVRVRGAGRDERRSVFDTIAGALDAEIVNTIGGVGVLYRANPERGEGSAR
ncbi:MAG: ribosome assembly RNA-binding protein YhbY [Gammaproteobacteria bacterium]